MATEYIKPISDISKELSPNTGTDNFAMVDDATDGTHDGNTTKVFASTPTAWAEDQYGMQNLSASSGTCSVKLKGIANYGADGGKIKLGVKVGSTVYYESEQTLTSEFALYESTWANNPSTDSPWSISEVNDLIGVLSLHASGKITVQATCFFGEVTVTEGGTVTIGKVLGKTVASISKVAGVAWASIAKIAGKTK